MWPERTLVIALRVKSRMAAISSYFRYLIYFRLNTKSFTISMYAVGFPGMLDLVVQVQHFIVDKVEDGRHLTKSNKIYAKHFFYHCRQKRRFMTLVSTIGFSYTHQLVALSINHFGHFRFQKPKWRPPDKIGNRGGGGRIGYHMGHMAMTREHISLSFGNNTASLSWPFCLSNDRHLGI